MLDIMIMKSVFIAVLLTLGSVTGSRFLRNLQIDSDLKYDEVNIPVTDHAVYAVKDHAPSYGIMKAKPKPKPAPIPPALAPLPVPVPNPLPVPVPAPTFLPGGYSEVDTGSEEVQAAAAFAVEDYGPEMTYEVVKAFQQVVAGTKYSLTIAIIEEPETACTMNNFMVFKNLNQTYELLSKETLIGVDCPLLSTSPLTAPPLPSPPVEPESWLCLSIYGRVPDSWFAALCLKEELAKKITSPVVPVF